MDTRAVNPDLDLAVKHVSAVAAAGTLRNVAPGTRAQRMEKRERNPKWKNPPLYIDMSICINCDTCIRHCPPQFGAIFNHGMDVIIIPELCSGCNKCIDPCPVDCIYEVEGPVETPIDWWQAPEDDDPYR